MTHQKPTELLTDEHKSIKKMLKILERVSQKLESGEEVNPDHLEKIVYFIRGFADKCHHAKEEDLLFPAMIDSGVPKEGGPIGVMLQEHDEGRGYVGQMKEAAEKYKDGDKSLCSQFIENGRNFINLLSQHIDKEDNILYQIANMHISEKGMAELWEEFERVEREKIGPGKHEAFMSILKELETEYLEGSE